MSFMKKQVTNQARWILVDGPCGIDAIPFDVVFSNPSKKTMMPTFEDVRDYTENREAWTIEVRDGYGARMSAPGYMDCTAWTVHDTEQEAWDSLADYDDESESDSEDELIPLADMDAWRAFVAMNEEALRESYGSIEQALKACREGGLVMGGGAAPTFRIYFTE